MIWAWIILLRPIWNQGNLQLIPKSILPTQTETTQLFLIPMELWTKHLCGKPMVTSWQIWRFITLLGSYFRSRPVGLKMKYLFRFDQNFLTFWFFSKKNLSETATYLHINYRTLKGNSRQPTLKNGPHVRFIWVSLQLVHEV